MPVSENHIVPCYSQEDIQQILQIAIARQAHDTEFTREQLVEIATELDISLDCLQQAEQEWSTQQGELQKRESFNAYRRSKFNKSLGKYIIVNSFLVPLNFLSAGELSWSLYILLLWGLGLGLNAWKIYQSQGEEYEQAFKHWYRQHQVREFFNSFFNRLLKA